ncbi:MAG: FAD-dependent monooxygenase [Lonepinella koalarum]|nr:FAD-dependent monooxygenase [Lonepinella koalarum]
MKNVDLIIIGGGMVGLALAASLKECDLKIALVERSPLTKPISEVGFRVSAINLASENLLRQTQVWENLPRKTAYRQMQVWERDSFAQIHFDSNSLGLSHLGHIVENHLIQQALLQQVSTQKNTEILTALPIQVNVGEDNLLLQLNDGQFLCGKLIVGADGANSWLRKQADIPLSFRDYGHHALVCNVKTAEPHQHTARQIFSGDSILAFLPLHEENLCSIVWSLPPEKAEFLTHCDNTEFNKQLSVAFDHQLGLCEVQSARQTYPLTARYARNFAQHRIALIGDAAHTIHPLAGLGVNLGFQDALMLATEIKKYLHLQQDIGKYRHLRNFERHRKTEAVKMLATMQGLKELFATDNPLKKFIRGIGLSAVDKLPILKDELIKQALGL